MASDAGIPVTVIGGYLGAGKTTLVNHLLRHAGRRIAVVVNDFGDLPIDQDLIVGASGGVLTLAGGCVCCSIGEDFLGGLVGMARRPDIDHLLVEASGVALPGSIARTVALARGLKHEATIIVIDSETFHANTQDKYIGDTVMRQLADADLLVANKAALVSDVARSELRAFLREHAPGAELLFAERADVAPDIILGSREKSPFVCDEPRSEHDTGLIDSVSFEIDGRVDVSALAKALADASLGLARAKGFAQDVNGAWKAIQVVGRRAEIADVSPRKGAGRLVCIAHGQAIDRERISAALRARQSH
ncbi:MAG: GTP-binding protein [Hyphomicrobiales bacterium]|nr:GTP-binding protein [Hyphomicrobiales bacterium]